MILIYRITPDMHRNMECLPMLNNHPVTACCTLVQAGSVDPSACEQSRAHTCRDCSQSTVVAAGQTHLCGGVTGESGLSVRLRHSAIEQGICSDTRGLNA